MFLVCGFGYSERLIADGFSEGMSWGATEGARSKDISTGTTPFDPTTEVPQYSGTSHTESDYYNNQDPTSLETDAALMLPSHGAGQEVYDEAVTPNYTVSGTDPIIVRMVDVESNTTAHTGTITTTTSACTPDVQTTPPITHEESCVAWKVPVTSSCAETLNVTVNVVNNPSCTVGEILVRQGHKGAEVSGTDYTSMNYAVFCDDLSAETARIKMHGGSKNWHHGNNWFAAGGGRPSGFVSDGIHHINEYEEADRTLGFNSWGGAPFVWPDLIVDSSTNYPTWTSLGLVGGYELLVKGQCDSVSNICTFQFDSSGPYRRSILGVRFTLPHYHTVVTEIDDWVNACASFQARSDCVLNSRACTDGPATKIINGESVYRACWEYTSEYTCGGTAYTPETHCSELLAKGCTMTHQDCDADRCIQYYECQDSPGTSTPIENCSTQTFSMAAGYTFDTGYAPNNDFGQVASTMTALEEAVSGIDVSGASCVPDTSGNYNCTGNVVVFSGNPMKCGIKMLSFANCCKVDGWGIDASLASCETEEYQLGLSRQNRLCTYVGDYCAHKGVFGCEEVKETYCCFNSVLSRIVQEQGRPQLSMGWGSAKAPDCRGLTDSELNSIDFSLIDFSEFYEEALANIAGGPDSNAMETMINDFVGRLTSSPCSQYDEACLNAHGVR